MQSIPSGSFFKTYEAQVRADAVQRVMERLKAARIEAYENADGLFVIVPSDARAWQTGRNESNGFLRYEIQIAQMPQPVDFELPETLRLELVQR